MSVEQALVVYLTCALLTFCFLGATSRLPGQARFRADNQVLAARKTADAASETSLKRELALARREGIAHCFFAVAMWPVYWGFSAALSVMATAKNA